MFKKPPHIFKKFSIHVPSKHSTQLNRTVYNIVYKTYPVSVLTRSLYVTNHAMVCINTTSSQRVRFIYKYRYATFKITEQPFLDFL